jgi:hypothetical protein
VDRPAAGEEVRMALDSGTDMAARRWCGTGYIGAGSEEGAVGIAFCAIRNGMGGKGGKDS